MIQISLIDTQCLHIIDNASDFPILEMMVVDTNHFKSVDEATSKEGCGRGANHPSDCNDWTQNENDGGVINRW